MKHVTLDARDESVKSFVLELARSPEGSLLELNGQPIAYVSPSPRPGPKRKKEAWTNAKNERRCNLIDKEIDGTLTVAEAMELHELQQEMLDYRRRIAPLPIEAARALHKQLLNKPKKLDVQE